ncbi:MAG: hypothetical protein ABIO57_03025 [Candidatus Paceibacterota bacterium]
MEKFINGTTITGLVVLIIIALLIYNEKKSSKKDNALREQKLKEEEHLRTKVYPWIPGAFFTRYMNQLFIVEEILSDRIGVRYIGKYPIWIKDSYGYTGEKASSEIKSLRGDIYFLPKEVMPEEVLQLDVVILFKQRNGNEFDIEKYHIDSRYYNSLFKIGTYTTKPEVDMPSYKVAFVNIP